MDINAQAVRVFSLIGIVIHGVLFGFCVWVGGLSDGPAPDSMATLTTPIISLPLLYFIFCIVSSLTRYKGWPLFAAGIVAHLLIVVPYYRMIRQGAGILAIIPVLTALCWFLMASSRLRGHDG